MPRLLEILTRLGPRTIPEVANILHIKSATVWHSARQAKAAGTIRICGHYALPGCKKPSPVFEIVAEIERNITPAPYRAQIARKILAQNTQEGTATAIRVTRGYDGSAK